MSLILAFIFPPSFFAGSRSLLILLFMVQDVPGVKEEPEDGDEVEHAAQIEDEDGAGVFYVVLDRTCPGIYNTR